MTSRRSKLAAGLAACVLAVFAGAAAAAPAPLTAATATDEPSRLVLSHTLQRLDQGANGPTDGPRAIHRNLPQVIEQNFARLRPAEATRLLDNLSDRELADLGAVYTAASNDAGREPRLLHVLAHRLDARRLSRLSGAFGYSAVYAAVADQVPAKAQQLAMLGAPVTPMTSNLTRYWNYTPYEIYLDLRTAPVGALSVRAALYEASSTVGFLAWSSWKAGQLAGDLIAPVIQQYAPDVWDAIGGTVYNMVNQLQTAADLIQQGQIMPALGATFGLTPPEASPQEQYGGDYGASDPWYEYGPDGAGNGGGPCRGAECYPHSQE